mgnify:CR=1 FL=1
MSAIVVEVLEPVPHVGQHWLAEAVATVVFAHRDMRTDGAKLVGLPVVAFEGHVGVVSAGEHQHVCACGGGDVKGVARDVNDGSAAPEACRWQ